MVMRIRTQGLKELTAYFKAKPAQVKRAARKTVRQITNELHKELGGTIPRDAGTSVGGFRRVRAKKKTPKGRQRTSRGSVWMGTNRIQAEYAGRAKAIGSDVKVGKYFFKNAFIMKYKSGHEAVILRIGRGKIAPAYVNLPNSHAITRAAVNKARYRLKDKLRENIRIEFAKGR